MKDLLFREPTRNMSEPLVAAFESVIGFHLPNKYREFLLKTNGGQPSRKNNTFFVVDNPDLHPDFREVEVDLFFHLHSEDYPDLELRVEYSTFLGRVPRETIPIATDPFGNLFLLGVHESVYDVVFFWDHETEGFNKPVDPFHNVGRLANSFESFVDALVEEPSDF